LFECHGGQIFRRAPTSQVAVRGGGGIRRQNH
jgi:hypothetical protein